MRENTKTLWGIRWNFSRFFQIIDLLQWPILKAYLFSFSMMLLIVHTLAIRQECSWHVPPHLSLQTHHHQNAERSKSSEKKSVGEGGKFFQREPRESVKNSRIWGGGCKYFYDCGGIFVAKVAQYPIACHSVPFLTSSFL